MSEFDASVNHVRLELDTFIVVDTMTSVVYNQKCICIGTFINKVCEMTVQVCSRLFGSYLLP
jgi:hypothetical protein